MMDLEDLQYLEEKVRKNYKELVSDTDLTCYEDDLYSKFIFTQPEKESIDCLDTIPKKNRLILDLIIRRGDVALKAFLDVLRKEDNEWYRRITTTDVSSFRDEGNECNTEEEKDLKRKIRANRPSIIKRITTPVEIADGLFSRCVIELEDLERVVSKSTLNEKNVELLDIIFTKDEGFKPFLEEVSNHGHDELRQTIQTTELESKEPFSQRAQTDNQLGKKDILFCCSTEEHEENAKLYIHFLDEKKELSKHENIANLWTTTIKIELTGFMKYKYELVQDYLTKRIRGGLGFKTDKRVFDEDRVTSGKGNCIRDTFMNKRSPECLLAHCKHVLSASNETCLSEITRQLDTLFIGDEFNGRQYVDDLYKHSKHTFKEKVVFVTILSYLSDIGDLTGTACKDLLIAFEGKTFDEISNARKMKIKSVLLTFLENVYDKEASLIHFVSYAYPFLNENELWAIFDDKNTKIQHCANSLWEEHNKRQWIDRTENFVKTICNRVLRGEATTNWVNLLRNVLYVLPLDVSVNCWKKIATMLNENEKHKEKVGFIEYVIYQKIGICINELERTTNFTEYLKFWENLDDSMKDKFSSKMAKSANSVLDCLFRQSEDTKIDCEAIGKMCKHHDLFRDEETQHHLLSTLVLFSNQNCRNLFISLISIDSFVQLSKDSVSNLVRKFFDTLFNVSVETCDIYQIQSIFQQLVQSLQKLSCVDWNQDLKNRVFDQALNFLEKIEIKLVIKTLKSEWQDELAEEEFCMGLTKMIETGQLGEESNNKILKVLNKRGDVNSRGKAKLILASVECIVRKLLKGDCEQLLLYIAKKKEIWMNICFKAHGKESRHVTHSQIVLDVRSKLEEYISILKKKDIDIVTFRSIKWQKVDIIEIYDHFGMKFEFIEKIDIIERDMEEAKELISETMKYFKFIKNSICKFNERNLDSLSFQRNDECQLVRFFEYAVEDLENLSDGFETGDDKNLCDVLNMYIFRSHRILKSKLCTVCDALSSMVFLELNTPIITVYMEQITTLTNIEKKEELQLDTTRHANETRLKEHLDHAAIHCSEKEIDRTSITMVFAVIEEFFECLLSECLKCYKSHIEQFTIADCQSDICLEKVNTLFKEYDISKEIELAQQLLKVTFLYKYKVALEQYEIFPYKKEQIEVVKSLLDALSFRTFNFSSFLQWYRIIEKLMNDQLKEIYLLEASESLQNIHLLLAVVFSETEKKSASEKCVLSKEDPMMDLLKTIGQSTNLLVFLHETINEDFRNFMDAAGEYSENRISESTVSSLIDVQRYIKPILLMSDRSRVKEVLECLIRNREELLLSNMKEKIQDCMKNLSAIYRLYDNMTSKGHRLSYSVASVVRNNESTNCNIKFFLSTNGYTFDITYLDGSIQKASEVLDMKSRALLIMATKSKVDFEAYQEFVSKIECALDIVDLCDKLDWSGHLKFLNYQCETPIGNINCLLDDLQKEYTVWKEHVEATRKFCRYVNYFTGRQLRALQKAVSENDTASIILQLKYLNPDIQTDHLERPLAEFKKELDVDNVAFEKIEDFLKTVFKDIKFRRRLLKIHTEKESNRNCNSSFSLVLLENNSQSLISTIFSLYFEKSDYIPEANQLIFCNTKTRWKELDLMLMRCVYDCKSYDNSPLYCIALVERLHFKVQERLMNRLADLLKKHKLRMVLIVEGTKDSRLVRYFSEYLDHCDLLTDKDVASCLQRICRHITVLTSDRPGLGKTESILTEAHKTERGVKTLHISGPVRINDVMTRLSFLDLEQRDILHIDIGMTNDCLEIDILLFQLCLIDIVSYNTETFALPCSSSPTQVYIEISNSINDTLSKSLTVPKYLKRKHLRWENFTNFTFSEDVDSAERIVLDYLIRRHNKSLDSNDDTGVLTEPKELLSSLWRNTEEVSFSTVHIFFSVLSEQLKCLGNSSFFQTKNLSSGMLKTKNKDEIKINTIMVEALIDVSKTFAKKSVQDIHLLQDNAVLRGSRSDALNMLASREKEMIRWKDSHHLIIVFHALDKHRADVLYQNIEQVPNQIKEMYKAQGKVFEELDSQTSKDRQTLLINICRSNQVPIKKSDRDLLNKTFSVTNDNMLKMILISMRIRSNVPVIITGETGCGKTSLIRFLATICGVSLEIYNIHAGREENAIVDKINESHQNAMKNLKMQFWLFFDEINANENVGLLCDVLCHRRLFGKCLAPNLTIIGACNPYRLRLNGPAYTKGLRDKIEHDMQSHLVYRVHPLPESVFDFVWDFGELSEKDERDYISVMVKNCREITDSGQDIQTLFTNVLVESQNFFRSKASMETSVSLRDIERCKHLVNWFASDYFIKKDVFSIDNHIFKAIILSLAHCYLFRIPDKSERRAYLEVIASCLNSSKTYKTVTAERLQKIVREEQSDIVKRMNISDDIAANSILLENVFVLLISILNKIPLFLIGKPGCSKSLSMQLIRNSLKGRESEDELFRKWPQVIWKSFQGTETSTSDDIIKVFDSARRIQENNTKSNRLPLVVLDEIGLAESSPSNPLKVLHDLLEPDGNPYSDVAIVGISNWTLDSAKMNRAVHISCQELTLEDLVETAKRITRFHGKFNRELKQRIPIEAIAKAFQAIEESQSDNFFGLRDFYSLIQYLSHQISEENVIEQDIVNVVLTGVSRNFGGSQCKLKQVLSKFKEYLDIKGTTYQSPSAIDLIRENIKDKRSRHLMIIPNGDSVINQLQQILEQINRRHMTLLGSNFHLDKSVDYNYRILNQVILCMEQGNILILKDLEDIYGSLYDMLNQNFTLFAKKKHCRIALGPHSNPMCFVHEAFRCIVILEQNKLLSADPPFLNRFEKQEFNLFSLLSDSQKRMCEEISMLLCEMLVNKADAMGICEEIFQGEKSSTTDLMSSLVLFVDSLAEEETTSKEFKNLCLLEVLKISKPEFVLKIQSSVHGKKHKKETSELLFKYFDSSVHEGLQAYIEDKMDEEQIFYPACDTFSPVAKIEDENSFEMPCNTDDNQQRSDQLQCTKACNLHMVFTHDDINCVQTLDFADACAVSHWRSKREMEETLNDFWRKSDKDVLLVYMDAEKDMKHFLLVQSFIESKHTHFKTGDRDSNDNKHIFMIIHIPRNKNVCLGKKWNFLSKWQLVYLDNLNKPKSSIPYLYGKTIANILCSRENLLSRQISNLLPSAFRRIQYSYKKYRASKDIQYITESLQSLQEVLELFTEHTLNWNSNDDNSNWILDTAFDAGTLHLHSSMTNALESRILEKIRDTLIILIFQLEECGCLDSILQGNISRHKLNAWKKHFLNKNVFQITYVPERHMPANFRVNSYLPKLRTPFFTVFIDKVEKVKSVFQKRVKDSMDKKDIKQQSTIPPEDLKNVSLSMKEKIQKNLKDFLENEYEDIKRDYTHDFCVYVSSKYFSRNDDFVHTDAVEKIINLLQILDYPRNSLALLVTSLHTTLWAYSSDIFFILELLHVGETVFNLNPDIVCDKVLNLCTGEISVCNLIKNLLKVIIPDRKHMRAIPLKTLLSKLSHVLSLSKQFDKEMQISHSIRFCHDFAVCILSNRDIQCDNFIDILDLLVHDDFDITSKEISKQIWTLLDSVNSDCQMESINLHCAAKLYIKMCFDFGECEGLAQVEQLIDRIRDKITFEPTLECFGPIIEMTLKPLGLESFVEDFLSYDQLNIPHTVTSKRIIEKIDLCLSVSSYDTILSSVLVQILQNSIDSYFSKPEKYIGHFAKKASSILDSGKMSFIFCAAVAYLKSFLKHVIVSYQTKYRKTLFSVAREILQKKDSRHYHLRLYFYRLLGYEGIHSLLINVRPFIEFKVCDPLDMNKRYIGLCFEMWPLINITHACRESEQSLDAGNFIDKLKQVSMDNLEHFDQPRNVYRRSDIISEDDIELLSHFRNDIIGSILTPEMKDGDKHLALCIINIINTISSSSSKGNIWRLMLFNPSKAEDEYVPAQGLKCYFFRKQSAYIRTGLCTNNHRYAMDLDKCPLSNSDKCQCPVCHSLPKVNEFIEKSNVFRGFITDVSNELKKALYTRGELSPVAFRVVQLLNTSCLICSLLFDFGARTVHLDTSPESMCVMKRKQLASAQEMMVSHWNALMGMLLLSNNELGRLLQVVVSRIGDFFKRDEKFESQKERAHWEKEFSRKIDSIVRKKEEYLHKEIFDYNNIQEFQTSLFEVEFDENVGEHKPRETEIKTELYQRPKEPTYENLYISLTLMDDINRYPVLSLAIEKADILVLPKHLVSIVEWHNAATQLLQNTAITNEDRKLSLSYFLQKQRKPDLIKDIKAAFKSFRNSMTELKRYEDVFYTYSDEHVQLYTPEFMSLLEMCLIFDTDSQLYKVVNILAAMQNDFIDDALKASVCFNRPSTSCLNQDEGKAAIGAVPITEIKSHDILHFEMTNAFIKENSQCGTTFTTARRISYDFQNMELEVVSHVLHGKSFITDIDSLVILSLSKSPTVSLETLLESVSAYVTQCDITDTVKHSYETFYTDYPARARQLMALLEEVFTVLGQLGKSVDENVPLEKFLKDNEIEHYDIPEVQEPMSTIVYVYRYLEELHGRYVIEKLSGSEEIKPNEMASVQHSLQYHGHYIQHLLQALRIFAKRNLSTNCSDQSSKDFVSSPLRSHLLKSSYWCDGCDACEDGMDIVEIVQKTIPDGIRVSQIKYFVGFLEENIQKNVPVI